MAEFEYKKAGEKEQKAELLAPAGTYETLKAVAQAGADAVYAGGNRFGARAYAGNLSDQELLSAIDYLHIHEKRLYLTVNTLFKERELSGELYDYILPLYRQGLDGVIVQDLGVFSFLRKEFPDLPLHASTQMTLTGVEGARLLQELGASRIVTARELSLTEIRKIHEETGIEIESFIHGALCYCYSGQCLLSSMIGGRSGNRGRCAQPCRLPYRVKGSKEAYFLSPKDLCAISLLPQILDAGVYSLKIEGRMKQTAYAAGVTSIYRHYLDLCLSEGYRSYSVLQDDMEKLLSLGNRSGFTNGYYEKKNGPDMMAMHQSSHTKENRFFEPEDGKEERPLQEPAAGTMVLKKGEPARLTLSCRDTVITVQGQEVLPAQNRPLTQDEVRNRMKKTGGTPFCLQELSLTMEDDCFLPVGAINQLRRDGFLALQEQILMSYHRGVEQHCGCSLRGEGKTAEGQNREVGEPDEERLRWFYLAVRTGSREQCAFMLQQERAAHLIDRIYIDSAAFRRESELLELSTLAKQAHEAGILLFYQMPLIVREKEAAWYRTHRDEFLSAGIDGVLVGTLDALHLVSDRKDHKASHFQVQADSSLYCWNTPAYEALRAAGADEVTLPVEEKETELLHRGYCGGEMILYGYLPLMVSAQCVRTNADAYERKGSGICSHDPGFLLMKDRMGKEFPVQNVCKYCYNVLYNSAPLSLLHQAGRVKNLNPSGVRISFTRETPEEMTRVIGWYEQAFCRGEQLDRSAYDMAYTNGHFARGVE